MWAMTSVASRADDLAAPPGLAPALVIAVVLSGCGAGSRAAHGGAGVGTSTAAAVVAFVALVTRSDAAVGGELAERALAQTVQSTADRRTA